METFVLYNLQYILKLIGKEWHIAHLLQLLNNFLNNHIKNYFLRVNAGEFFRINN